MKPEDPHRQTEDLCSDRQLQMRPLLDVMINRSVWEEVTARAIPAARGEGIVSQSAHSPGLWTSTGIAGRVRLGWPPSRRSPSEMDPLFGTRARDGRRFGTPTGAVWGWSRSPAALCGLSGPWGGGCRSPAGVQPRRAGSRGPGAVGAGAQPESSRAVRALGALGRWVPEPSRSPAAPCGLSGPWGGGCRSPAGVQPRRAGSRGPGAVGAGAQPESSRAVRALGALGRWVPEPSRSPAAPCGLSGPWGGGCRSPAGVQPRRAGSRGPGAVGAGAQPESSRAVRALGALGRWVPEPSRSPAAPCGLSGPWGGGCRSPAGVQPRRAGSRGPGAVGAGAQPESSRAVRALGALGRWVPEPSRSPAAPCGLSGPWGGGCRSPAGVQPRRAGSRGPGAVGAGAQPESSRAVRALGALGRWVPEPSRSPAAPCGLSGPWGGGCRSPAGVQPRRAGSRGPGAVGAGAQPESSRAVRALGALGRWVPEPSRSPAAPCGLSGPWGGGCRSPAGVQPRRAGSRGPGAVGAGAQPESSRAVRALGALGRWVPEPSRSPAAPCGLSGPWGGGCRSPAGVQPRRAGSRGPGAVGAGAQPESSRAVRALGALGRWVPEPSRSPAAPCGLSGPWGGGCRSPAGVQPRRAGSRGPGAVGAGAQPESSKGAEQNEIEALQEVLEKLKSKRGPHYEKKFGQVPMCDAGEQCAVRKGARIGKLCDCPRGTSCNSFLLKCL
ncbi:PREDICTED: cocaine- and amphetamine-regulated transcript protein [Ficedula albicollis]|nr:PREDICTED: cocaine- and amphetamine-regulated transcript protein [Ficedula albicollis]